MPLLARRIAESPEFSSGQHKLSTVLSRISEPETPRSCPLRVLAMELREPIGLPTGRDGHVSPIGSIPLSLKGTSVDIPVSNYDHVVLYPPSSARARSDYALRRLGPLFDALRIMETRGIESNHYESEESDRRMRDDALAAEILERERGESDRRRSLAEEEIRKEQYRRHNREREERLNNMRESD